MGDRRWILSIPILVLLPIAELCGGQLGREEARLIEDVPGGLHPLGVAVALRQSEEVFGGGAACGAMFVHLSGQGGLERIQALVQLLPRSTCREERQLAAEVEDAETCFLVILLGKRFEPSQLGSSVTKLDLVALLVRRVPGEFFAQLFQGAELQAPETGGTLPGPGGAEIDREVSSNQGPDG